MEHIESEEEIAETQVAWLELVDSGDDVRGFPTRLSLAHVLGYFAANLEHPGILDYFSIRPLEGIFDSGPHWRETDQVGLREGYPPFTQHASTLHRRPF